MKVQELSEREVYSRLRDRRGSRPSPYLAMYSTWWGGLVREPHLMMVPIDDHMVHRGDAVFEAFKSVDRKIYLLDAHLQRLERSARAIDLQIPMTASDLRDLVRACATQIGESDMTFRLYVARGPGGFTANPYESVGAQIYLVLTRSARPSATLYERGATAGVSRVPVKEGLWATVKSCNYLPNVLMKKEAVDRGLDFTINVDGAGQVGEGSTENLMIVNHNGDLLYPGLSKILSGTTMLRLAHLADSLVQNGLLRSVGCGDFRLDDLKLARELWMVGTTWDVMPVTQFEGRPIGDGAVGPAAKKALELLRADMRGNSDANLAY